MLQLDQVLSDSKNCYMVCQANKTACSFLLLTTFVLLDNPDVILMIVEKQLEKISLTLFSDKETLPQILVLSTLLKLILPLNS